MCINLGAKSNRAYLLTHGFTVEKNVATDGSCPNDVEVRVTVGPERFRRPMRSVWDNELDSGGAEASVLLSATDNDSWDNVLSLLRIVVSTEVFHVNNIC